MLLVQPVAARRVRQVRRLRPAQGRLPLPALLDAEAAGALWRHAHRLALEHLLPVDRGDTEARPPEERQGRPELSFNSSVPLSVLQYFICRNF